MSAPALQAYANGAGAVSGDNLNTFQQTCDNVTDLRGFIGVPGINVYVRGFASADDGGQGVFYWNSAGSQTDNGTTIIAPDGAATGAWNRLSFDAQDVVTFIISVPTTGFNITIANNITEYIINPAGTLATGTFVMPSEPYNGQRIRIASTQTVTALTVSANSGQTIVGAPTTLSSSSAFEMLYQASDTKWYRA